MRRFLYRWALEIAMVLTMSAFALATIIGMLTKP